MKLTTKRNRWYFWRELFSYMIPMILIVGTIDVFHNFMRCPLHPEWSAPCSVNRIIAAMYGFFLMIVIILAIISARMLRKVKNQIEAEFLQATKENTEILGETIRNNEESEDKEDKDDKIIVEEINVKKRSKPKKIIVDSDTTLKNKRKTKKASKNLG